MHLHALQGHDKLDVALRNVIKCGGIWLFARFVTSHVYVVQPTHHERLFEEPETHVILGMPPTKQSKQNSCAQLYGIDGGIPNILKNQRRDGVYCFHPLYPLSSVDLSIEAVVFTVTERGCLFLKVARRFRELVCWGNYVMCYPKIGATKPQL